MFGGTSEDLHHKMAKMYILLQHKNQMSLRCHLGFCFPLCSLAVTQPGQCWRFLSPHPSSSTNNCFAMEISEQNKWQKKLRNCVFLWLAGLCAWIWPSELVEPAQPHVPVTAPDAHKDDPYGSILLHLHTSHPADCELLSSATLWGQRG